MLVYWQMKRELIAPSCGLHRYCDSRYQKLRLLLKLVLAFANRRYRVRDVHPDDFEEAEVELEAMYGSVWSNIRRAWYPEAVDWEYFIQKVCGRFYLKPEYEVWSVNVDKHVDARCSWLSQAFLLADRVMLPVGLTALGLLTALSFLATDPVSEQAFWYYVVAIICVSLTPGGQGFLVYPSFHRRSRRYR